MEKNNHIIIINGSPRRSKNCSKIIENITKKLDENNIAYEVENIYKMICVNLLKVVLFISR